MCFLINTGRPRFEPRTGDLMAKSLNTRPPHLLKISKVNWFYSSFQFFTFTSISAEKTYSMNLVFTPKGNHFGIGKYFSYCISEHYLAKIFAWTFHDASSSSWTIELKTTEVINGVFEIFGCEGTKITAQMPLFRTSFFGGNCSKVQVFNPPKWPSLLYMYCKYLFVNDICNTKLLPDHCSYKIEK